jgi:hypothetical protein
MARLRDGLHDDTNFRQELPGKRLLLPFDLHQERVQKPSVGLLHPLPRGPLRLSAEGAKHAHVQEIRWGAVRLTGIVDNCPFVTDELAHEFGQPFYAQVPPGPFVDGPTPRVGVLEETSNASVSITIKTRILNSTTAGMI